MIGHRPCIIVAGLGRCGSSLALQMLAAAGVNCLGDWPAFEFMGAAENPFNPAQFSQLRDCAVKILDAHYLPIGEMPDYVVIWLSRDEREQAKSMLKFLSVQFPGTLIGRNVRRAFAASILKDTQPARAKFASLRGGRALSLTFEDIIRFPLLMSERMASFLDPFGYVLSPERMAGAVRKRPTHCLEGLLEFDLLEENRSHGCGRNSAWR